MSFPRRVVKTTRKLILALLVLVALAMPAVADEVDDLILDLFQKGIYPLDTFWDTNDLLVIP